MNYKLQLKYVYTFYSFDEEMDCDVIEESVEVKEENSRFTLHLQEDASFILSALKEDHRGKYVIVTYPNKDQVVVHENDSEELVLDEYFNSMGDDNHNVYEGVMTLVCD